MQFTIYVDGNTYYVIEEGMVVTCTFDTEAGSVTNAFGTFYKNGGSQGQGSSSATVAHIAEELRGEYSNGNGTTVFVQESSVTVVEATGGRMEYSLYTSTDNQIYFETNGEKVYCRFSTDGTSVTNKFGTFYKKSGGS